MNARRFLLFALLALAALDGFAAARLHVFLNGPSLTKHLGENCAYAATLNDFHWGVGVEIVRLSRRWAWGVHGHYMGRDSTNRSACWLGVTGGPFWGRLSRFWFSPALLLGGIRKREYASGRFAPFALPFLSAGYGRIGLNFTLIPPLPRNHYWIPLLQIKVRLL